MATMWLSTGKRYRAKLSLGFFERMASNETIRDKLRDAGFYDVQVTGDGGERQAIGTWGGATQNADLPSQVESVEEC